MLNSFNPKSYIEYLIQKRMNEEDTPFKTYDKLRGNVSKIGNYGNNLSIAGDFIKDNINSPLAQKLGTSISNLGGTVQNGANAASGVLNAPQNYFKGFAPQPFSALLNGTTAGTTAGTAAGTAAGTTAATTGATTAGTAGAAGAGAASGGAAAGGAAAGGSAASGAAAAGPIGALVALGVMAAMGTNRKRAKKSGEALMNSTNQIVNDEADAALNQTQHFAQNAQNQDYSQPVLTGAAAPVQELSPIQEYQEYLRGQGYSDDIINGVPQGLNGGNKEIADWINQYNNGTGKDNPINIPQTAEEIAAAKAGSFNLPIQAADATAQVKQGLLDKFINGLTDLSKGYQENKETAFAPENLQRDDSKGAMNRIGEVAGTISRAVQKPAVQALLAGGISTALTGNPLYGVGMAAKYGGNRAMSNIYQDALAKQGINANTGMFGSLTSSDMDSLMKPQYKAVEQQMANELLQERIRHNQEMENHYRMIDAARQQNANTNEYKAKNGTKVTHISNGGGKSTTQKPQEHKDWSNDLAGYMQIVLNPKYMDKTDVARARFIQKYGVDPEKYIKQ